MLATPTRPPAPSIEEAVSVEDVTRESDEFEGVFADSPDSVALTAECLGVREGDLEFVRTTTSVSDSPDRGFFYSFDGDGETDYVRSMVEHLRSGGELPPLLVADAPYFDEPYTIVDGNHRVAAYVLAGVVEEIPVFLARPRS